MGAVAARPVFCDPFALLSPQAQRLDQATAGLGRALPSRLERDRMRVDSARVALESAGARVLERVGGRLDALGDRLGDLSPVAILGRGYAICFDEDGRAVRDAMALSEGDRLDVRLGAGRAACTVDAVDEEARTEERPHATIDDGRTHES
jgi:exodeoxyribonuclease VII large subunit